MYTLPHRHRARFRGVLCAALMGGLALALPDSSLGQGLGARDVPSMTYFAAFGEFYDGEFDEALDTFEDEWRGAIKRPGMRWLDSICYYAMMGETYYQMGRLEEALDNYTAALHLYVQHNDWMVSVQFRPPNLANQRPCPWGTSQRGAKFGSFPEKMPIQMGEIDAGKHWQTGGLMMQAKHIMIHPAEIIRCTCLAIRRRTELLGPLSPYDPLTKQLLDVLSRRPAPPNHWSQSWIDAQLGLAQVAGGKDTEAIATLNRALVAAGQYDHKLTPTLLAELGRMALARGDFDAAASYFHEASISAYYYDAAVLEESLRLGTVAHLARGNKGVYEPLPTAMAWAKTNHHRNLLASLAIAAAECQLVANQPRDAAKLLGDAKSLVIRRAMATGTVGARYHYLQASLLFKEYQLAEGYEELTQATAFMQHASRWLFQLGRLDRQFLAGNITVSGDLTPRIAMELYEALLRDPTGVDWTVQPMESLAVLKTPHPQSFEHWFLIAMDRKSHERALEISDLARRHRFHSSLPFGGRLLSLRAILESPVDQLSRELLLERQNLLAEYPGFEALSQQAKQIRRELEVMPLSPQDSETSFKQRKAFEQWQAVSNQQEAVLREIAVRRESASLVFPPVRPLKEVREALPEGQVMLAFFTAKGETFAFLIGRDAYDYWRQPSSAKLKGNLVAALRGMGQFDGNREFTVEELADTEWRESAAALLTTILKGSQADFAAAFPELVVVPDGWLWYVPFESLQVEVDGNLRPLISRFRIRYAPTVSLAAPRDTSRAVAVGTETVVALGQLFPRDDEMAEAALERIAKAVPRTVPFPPSPLPAPSSVMAPLLKNLIVLDDIRPPTEGTYSWTPLQAERGKPGNMLADWFKLPQGGPQVIILPGFHTAAENSLKSTPAGAPGQEMFLSICALMANGADTIVLSRWRTGGQSSVGFVQEFAQELPYTTPADAFQRAVLLTGRAQLELDREPRVRDAREIAPNGSHPLFWSAFMLIHSGAADPPAVEPEAALRQVDRLR